jgi:CubicO group peptidase (beta-lactamase class C family)
MHSSRRLFLALASSVPLSVLSDEPITSDAVFNRLPAVDEFIRAEMRRQKVPGLALAIVSHGATVASKGYGLADVELDVPVRDDTVFQSGSVGKQFTAVCVMLQVEAR